jgi:nuclear pore complex protein Nup98-Nup96
VYQIDGIPQARLSLPFKFIDFISDQDPRDPGSMHEKLIWELASILFDPIDIPEDLKNFPAAFKFLRKDNLSAFWEKLVEQASLKLTSMAKSSEEKAIALLSGHRIPDACNNLLMGKNFHLATLVALLDGNESVRKNIREQLNEWSKARVLSEISQPIRAIYEILAGNVCVCDGVKGAPIEDRIDSFVMSKRFGLDWRQAFGLRLWYAISSSDELEQAVQKFAEDLQQDKESAKPFAWYVEQNISPLWDDQHLEEREDLLWGLLKLYSDRTTNLQAVLRPENSQLSPLNMRLSWQLSQTLTASGKCSYGDDADEKSDQLTLSFAAQLTNDGHWLDAVFVLLHLSSPSTCAKSIQDHLARHAGRIGSEDGPVFNTLVEDFKIPPSWVWQAKALYMRAVQKDPKREVECLIRAEAFDEAHRTFCKDVAPTAVIERDYETLRKLITGFVDSYTGINDWHLGGAIYADYLAVLRGQKTGKLDEPHVERLLHSLPAMLADARNVGFLERVAAQEMGACVAKVVVEMGKIGKVWFTSLNEMGWVGESI